MTVTTALTLALPLSLSVIACGCGAAGAPAVNAVDLCTAPELAGVTCLTLHLKGELSPGETSFETLQVDVTYQMGFNYVSHRVSPMRLDPLVASSQLPAVFGLTYPDLAEPTGNAGRVRVLARSGGKPVGYGLVRFNSGLGIADVKPGQHGQFTVTLASTLARDSGCFDGVRVFGESDTDCGGDCPLCDSGKKCEAASNGTIDCASNNCVQIPNVTQDHCQ